MHESWSQNIDNCPSLWIVALLVGTNSLSCTHKYFQFFFFFDKKYLNEMGKYVLFWVLMQATSCSDALSVLVWSNCYVCISLWQPSLASQQVPLFASRGGHMCRVLHRGLCLLMVWSNEYANHKWAISTFRACFLCSNDYFELDHLSFYFGNSYWH